MPTWILLLLALGATLILCSWLIWLNTRKTATLRERWQREQQARDIARCKGIEEALRDWLLTLELPQFADQMKLAASARRLRIVLVEQIANGPKVR